MSEQPTATITKLRRCFELSPLQKAMNLFFIIALLLVGLEFLHTLFGRCLSVPIRIFQDRQIGFQLSGKALSLSPLFHDKGPESVAGTEDVALKRDRHRVLRQFSPQKHLLVYLKFLGA